MLMGWAGVRLFKAVKTKQEERLPSNILLQGFDGVVLGAVIQSGGTGYSDLTNVSTIGGTGQQYGKFNCKVDITTTDGVVTGITINSGGIGYTLNDTLIIISGNKDCTFKANPVST